MECETRHWTTQNVTFMSNASSLLRNIRGRSTEVRERVGLDRSGTVARVYSSEREKKERDNEIMRVFNSLVLYCIEN